MEKDSEQPGTAICARLKLVKGPPGPKICLLHQIVRRFAVFANSERNAPQLTKMREGQSIKVFPSVCSHFVVLRVYGGGRYFIPRNGAISGIRKEKVGPLSQS
jgi:hypothetical protein